MSSIPESPSLSDAKKYFCTRYRFCELEIIPHKRIIFQVKDKSFLLFSPYSKYHETITGWWFDITKKQKDIFDLYIETIFLIRLNRDGIHELSYKKQLLPFLTSDYIQFNSHEGYHWKVYIKNNFLNIRNCNSNIQLNK